MTELHFLYQPNVTTHRGIEREGLKIWSFKSESKNLAHFRLFPRQPIVLLTIGHPGLWAYWECENNAKKFQCRVIYKLHTFCVIFRVPSFDNLVAVNDFRPLSLSQLYSGYFWLKYFLICIWFERLRLYLIMKRGLLKIIPAAKTKQQTLILYWPRGLKILTIIHQGILKVRFK